MTDKTKPRVELPEARRYVLYFDRADKSSVMSAPAAGIYFNLDDLHAYAQAYADALARNVEVELLALVEKWRAEQALYPSVEGADYAAAAVRCCANELEAALLAARAAESATKENQE